MHFLQQTFDRSKTKKTPLSLAAVRSCESMLQEGLAMLKNLRPAALAAECRQPFWANLLTSASTQVLMLCNPASPVPEECQTLSMELSLELAAHTGSATTLLQTLAGVIGRSHLPHTASLGDGLVSVCARVKSLSSNGSGNGGSSSSNHQQGGAAALSSAGKKSSDGNNNNNDNDNNEINTNTDGDGDSKTAHGSDRQHEQSPSNLLGAVTTILQGVHDLQPYQSRASPTGGSGVEPRPVMHWGASLFAMEKHAELSDVGIASMASYHATLIVTGTGTLVGVGENHNGLFGVSSTELASSSTAVLVRFPFPVQVASVAVQNHALAVTVSGDVYSWGKAGDRGQLGHGADSVTGVVRPRLVEGLRGENVVKVACGQRYSAAITENGTLFTWGQGTSSRLGFASTDDVREPKMVPNFDGASAATQAVEVACGHADAHTLVLCADGRVWSFGNKDNGKLGRSGDRTPAVIQGVDGVSFVSVKCGDQYSVILSDDGDVYTFGNLV